MGQWALPLLLLLPALAVAQRVVLVPYAGQWNVNEGTAGATWFTTTFTADSTWRAAKAPIGYGKGGEGTTVTTKTLFFARYKFTLATAYPSYIASIVADDGAVLYVNGAEVGRIGLPTGTLSRTSVATTNKVAPAELANTNITIPASAFVVGTNVLAIAVYNAAAGSTNTDMRFDMMLQAFAVVPTPVAASASPTPTISVSGGPVATAESIAITKKSTWRYRDTGEDLSTSNWRMMSYDDSAWSSGTGSFGYGDPSTTVLANKGITTYFRTTFLVQFLDQVVNAKVDVVRDDGVICYINGVEAFRSNMPPAGSVPDPASVLASTPVSGLLETANNRLDITIRGMRAGQNSLACEVHQDSDKGTDMGFDLSLLLYLRVVYRYPTPSRSQTRVSSGAPKPSEAPRPSTEPAPSPEPAPSVAPPSPDPSTSAAASRTPTPSTTRSSMCGACSCTCLDACPANDPLRTACLSKDLSSGGSKSSGASPGVVAGVVVGVVVGLGVTAALVLRYRRGKAAGANKDAVKNSAKRPSRGDRERVPSATPGRRRTVSDKETSKDKDKERSGRPSSKERRKSKVIPEASAGAAAGDGSGKRGRSKERSSRDAGSADADKSKDKDQSRSGRSSSKQPSTGRSGSKEPSKGRSGSKEPARSSGGSKEPTKGRSSSKEPSKGRSSSKEPSKGRSSSKTRA
jgi:hypothetical protein